MNRYPHPIEWPTQFPDWFWDDTESTKGDEDRIAWARVNTPDCIEFHAVLVCYKPYNHEPSYWFCRTCDGDHKSFFDGPKKSRKMTDKMGKCVFDHLRDPVHIQNETFRRLSQ